MSEAQGQESTGETNANAEVIVRVKDGVREIRINRPKFRNALTPQTLVELQTAVREAGTDKDTRALLLTGEGGAFCSGADLNAIDASQYSHPREVVTPFHDVILAIADCPKPIVALMDGPAAGFGAGLAMSCDLRVATERAYFQYAFVHIGLGPDGGTSFWPTRLAGLGRAAEMLLLGERIDAVKAESWGLVNRVVPVEEGEQAGLAMAQRLAKGPPLALRTMREMLYKNAQSSLADALEREKHGQGECIASEGFKEGLAAFLGKRAPNFPDE